MSMVPAITPDYIQNNHKLDILSTLDRMMTTLSMNATETNMRQMVMNIVFIVSQFRCLYSTDIQPEMLSKQLQAIQDRVIVPSTPPNRQPTNPPLEPEPYPIELEQRLAWFWDPDNDGDIPWYGLTTSDIYQYFVNTPLPETGSSTGPILRNRRFIMPSMVIRQTIQHAYSAIPIRIPLQALTHYIGPPPEMSPEQYNTIVNQYLYMILWIYLIVRRFHWNQLQIDGWNYDQKMDFTRFPLLPCLKITSRPVAAAAKLAEYQSTVFDDFHQRVMDWWKTKPQNDTPIRSPINMGAEPMTLSQTLPEHIKMKDANAAVQKFVIAIMATVPPDTLVSFFMKSIEERTTTLDNLKTLFPDFQATQYHKGIAQLVRQSFTVVHDSATSWCSKANDDAVKEIANEVTNEVTNEAAAEVAAAEVAAANEAAANEAAAAIVSVPRQTRRSVAWPRMMTWKIMVLAFVFMVAIVATYYPESIQTVGLQRLTDQFSFTCVIKDDNVLFTFCPKNWFTSVSNKHTRRRPLYSMSKFTSYVKNWLNKDTRRRPLYSMPKDSIPLSTSLIYNEYLYIYYLYHFDPSTRSSIPVRDLDLTWVIRHFLPILTPTGQDEFIQLWRSIKKEPFIPEMQRAYKGTIKIINRYASLSQKAKTDLAIAFVYHRLFVCTPDGQQHAYGFKPHSNVTRLNYCDRYNPTDFDLHTVNLTRPTEPLSEAIARGLFDIVNTFAFVMGGYKTNPNTNQQQIKAAADVINFFAFGITSKIEVIK